MNATIDTIGVYATVAGAMVAALALCVAAYQISVGRLEARRATAYGIYSDYLQLAIEYPHFSVPSYPVSSPGYGAIESDPKEFARYEFYVSRLLWATDELLRLGGLSEWRPVLVDQLKYHSLYFESGVWAGSHYSQAVVDLVDDALREYAADQA